MGVYQRPDSRYWWLWLETALKGQQKVRTDILIGCTKTDRKASRADADAVYHTRMLHAGKLRHGLPVPTDAITFDAFATWYDTHIVAQHRGAERERQILPRLRAAFGQLALTDPGWRETVIAWRTQRLVTPTRIAHAGKRRRGKPYTFPLPSASTVNREVGLLIQLLNKAVELQHLTSSPLAGLARLPVVAPLRRIMSDTEEQRILPQLAPVDRAIVIMGLDTLVRLGDILDLRWVDDHGDTLDIRAPKNGRPLRVPVSARLRAALDALPVDPACPAYVFAKRRRAASDHTRNAVVINALRLACEKAGVPYGRKQHGVTFHWATRRTGATRMIRQGGEKAIGVVQQIGGWQDLEVLIGIYQEVVTAEMRAAVETVAPKPPAVTPGPFPRVVQPATMARKRR